LEVYGHDGKATNITMQPGDMVLYESHSVIHGRPFPFKGKFFANVFVHFEPQGPLDEESTYDEDIPPYLVPGSKWEDIWWELNPNGWSAMEEGDDDEYDLQKAAINGEIDILEIAGKSYPESLHEPDEHGWLPLHEAVRFGHVDAVQVILKYGGNINHETYAGMSPLNIALRFLGEDHEMTKFLEDNGAVDLYPEL
jgi:prolyl 4-hydroxylase